MVNAASPPTRKRKSPSSSSEKPSELSKATNCSPPPDPRTSKRSATPPNTSFPPSSPPKQRRTSLRLIKKEAKKKELDAAADKNSPLAKTPTSTPKGDKRSLTIAEPAAKKRRIKSSSRSASDVSSAAHSSVHQRFLREMKTADEKEDAKAKERAFAWEQDVAKKCESRFKLDVIPHNNTGASFSNFPYAANKAINHALIHASFPVLQEPPSGHYPQTEPLKALNRHVLLSGPEGSQLYHDALVRSLAAEMEADLYIFDHRLFSSTAVVPKCDGCGSPFCLFGNYESLPTLASFTPRSQKEKENPLSSRTTPVRSQNTPTRSSPLPSNTASPSPLIAHPPSSISSSPSPPASSSSSSSCCSSSSTPSISRSPSPSPSLASTAMTTNSPPLDSFVETGSSESGTYAPPFPSPFAPPSPVAPPPSSSSSPTPLSPFAPPLLPSPPRSSSLFPSEDSLPALIDEREVRVSMKATSVNEVDCAVGGPSVSGMGAEDRVVGLRDSVGDVGGVVGISTGEDVPGGDIQMADVGGVRVTSGGGGSLTREEGMEVHLEDKGKAVGQKKEVTAAFAMESKGGVNRTFKIGDYVIYTGRTQLVPTSSPLQVPSSSSSSSAPSPSLPLSSSASSSPSTPASSSSPSPSTQSLATLASAVSASPFSLFASNSSSPAPSLSANPAPPPTPVPASFLSKTQTPRQHCNTLTRGLKGKIINISSDCQNAQVRFEQPAPATVDSSLPRQRLSRLTSSTGGSSTSSTKYETVEVQVSDLKLDPRPHLDRDAVGNIALEVLPSILSAKKKPAIVYFPDSEKSILSGLGRFSAVKKMVDSFTNSPVMVIASLFTKPKVKEDKTKSATFFLSNLLDFGAFDSLRKEDRAKPKPKPTRILARIFNLKLKVEDPKGRDMANLEDGGDVTGWKKFLSEGKQMQMLENNSLTLKRELKRLGLEVKREDSEKKGEEKSGGIKDICFSHPFLMTRELEATDVSHASGFALSRSAMKRKQAAEQSKSVTTPARDISMSPEKGDKENAKLSPSILNIEDLRYGLNLCSSLNSSHREKFGDIDMNEFEKKIATEVIDPSDIGVNFDDIGSLKEVKKILNDMVILPLKRPELFSDGILSKPGKGILLFGPPGTGKTMLAKAVATASGAYFLNVSMSLIGSKWFGEGEKYARAVFTLATKLSPCVIFIDEVDSLLGKRSNGEHEAMRKIKNEFMMMWDGLTTNEQSHVVILAATNRPFDLDDAVLRRLPRRLLVDLPDEANRVKILELMLKKEKLEDGFSIPELAKRTDGFTGSDLKSLSLAAAFRRIHDFLEEERKTKAKKEEKEKEEKEKEKESQKLVELSPKRKVDLLSETFEVSEESRKKPELRPLQLNDFVESMKEVKASVSEDSFSISELRRWNQMFGAGPGGKHSSLSYFM